MERQELVLEPSRAPEVPIAIGAGANAEEIGATAHHLLRGGKPWYPVMGEFHYSRYPAEEWAGELRKMKAAGVDIVATYVFWIHHEEEKGCWRWEGNLNLRRFLTLCRDERLLVLLRIGPWAHGECRNGGFPDWLQQDASIRARTDDPAYLALVRGLYGHIFEAAQGLLLKDGGPVIGVQLENEYGHCGGESGGQGLVHMRTLKRLAQEAGFLVPLYTATGWGGGNVVDGEMLPVMGGYADAPWERSLEPLPASPNFLLLPASNDPLIASDWQHGNERFTYQVDQYPYLTAELGGGVQCTFHRRPLISADDTVAQALCKLATGANLLGYYMFHGGTHPLGKHSTLQESTASGSYTDVPVRSYDFQAPIGESGCLHESYFGLKALHSFIHAVGESLAGSMYHAPKAVVDNPENVSELRWCVRYNADTEEGFLFINNHQRLRTMAPHHDVRFVIQVGAQRFELPPMDIPSDFYGVIPFNLRVGSARLLTTNGQLLGFLGTRPVLYTGDGQPPVACFEGDHPEPLWLTRWEALHAWRVGEKLVIGEGCIVEEAGRGVLLTEKPKATLRVLPEDRSLTVSAPEIEGNAAFRELSRTDTGSAYQLEIGEIPWSQVEDALLEIDFTGDHAELYQRGVLIADWYTTGQPWRTALKRFAPVDALELRVYPVLKPTYFEIPTPLGVSLNNVRIAPVYRIELPV